MRHSILALAGIFLLQAPSAVARPAGATTVVMQDAKTPQRTEIKVPEKVLKTYVGEYELTPERILTITLEGGSLWGQPSNQEKRQLFA